MARGVFGLTAAFFLAGVFFVAGAFFFSGVWEADASSMDLLFTA
ncbi:hypothetical protein [Pseudomonas sp. 3A(2025)]